MYDVLIFSRSFQSFFFSHIMLIENYVHQLKSAIDKALAKRSQDLIREVQNAWNAFHLCPFYLTMKIMIDDMSVVVGGGGTMTTTMTNATRGWGDDDADDH